MNKIEAKTEDVKEEVKEQEGGFPEETVPSIADIPAGGTVTTGQTVQSEGGVGNPLAAVRRPKETVDIEPDPVPEMPEAEKEEPAEGSLEWAAAQGTKEDKK